MAFYLCIGKQPLLHDEENCGDYSERRPSHRGQGEVPICRGGGTVPGIPDLGAEQMCKLCGASFPMLTHESRHCS